jgi:hypothetical protein
MAPLAHGCLLLERHRLTEGRERTTTRPEGAKQGAPGRP